ncbi:MAG: hypothetical protein DYH20_07395 [Gammaproteobacteria bacterium PRO9]|nr:hypothetical protein [Gammaproteobacteria bacterium PRO9]
MTRDTEARVDAEYNDSEVRRATVHMREDIVLVVSQLSSLNNQLIQVNRLLLLVIALLAVGLFVG